MVVKIIFDYNVYYVSDNDTFVIERDKFFDFENKEIDIVKLKIFQNGKCIADVNYVCNILDLCYDILGMPLKNIDKHNEVQFGLYKISNGGCH